MNRRQRFLLALVVGAGGVAIAEALQGRNIVNALEREGVTLQLATPFGPISQHLDLASSDDGKPSPGRVILPADVVVARKRIHPVSVVVGGVVTAAVFIAMGR